MSLIILICLRDSFWSVFISYTATRKPVRAFDDTAFELYSDAQITEGKSIDAGLWAMFCIAFLRRKFPSEFGRIAAPRCGTVLTGEIDSSGKVRPVSGTISQKLTCAFDEFGPDRKVL